MKLTFLGQAGFRIETGGTVLLLDPWLRDNPVFDNDRFDEAIEGADYILVTHAHFDHAADVVEIARKTGATPVGILEYASWLQSDAGLKPLGFNIGGTVRCGPAEVTMVRASHSSSAEINGIPHYLGTESSLVVAAEGRTLYCMGDTDVHADMAIHHDLHQPDVGIVPVGGHFTMDARRAAYACRKFFDFKTIIPCHFGTFPLLAPNADEFVALMEGEGIIVPKVMEPFEI